MARLSTKSITSTAAASIFACDKDHKCATCGVGPAAVRFMRCSVCKAVTYCGAACQREDWKTHKRTCYPASNLAVSS
jgi:hypothetical protein